MKSWRTKYTTVPSASISELVSALLQKYHFDLANSYLQPTRAWPTMKAPPLRSVSKPDHAYSHICSTNLWLVANEQGSFTTPSFVSFTTEERLIGEAAKNQAAMNPENTVFDVKWVHNYNISKGRTLTIE